MKKNKWQLPTTYVKVACECGEILHFHQNYPAICNRCGRKVYPTKEWEFKDKIKKYVKRLGVKDERKII